MAKNQIFYVDDDADDRLIMVHAFQDYRDQVELVLFDNGLDLLNHLNKNSETPPCLILLDLNMPKLDGKDTLRLIRNNSKYDPIPVIIFTTSSLPSDSYFVRHFKAGFYTKPLDLHQMTPMIEKFVSFCTENATTKANQSSL